MSESQEFTTGKNQVLLITRLMSSLHQNTELAPSNEWSQTQKGPLHSAHHFQTIQHPETHSLDNRLALEQIP